MAESPRSPPRSRSLVPLAERCSACHVGEAFCLRSGLEAHHLAALDGLVHERLRLRRGREVFSTGERLGAIYAVHDGTVATHAALEDGRVQIVALATQSQFVGLEAIAHDTHPNDATAMEDSVLCVIPFHELRRLAQDIPTLQHNLMRILSQHIRVDQRMLLTLGAMRAEERLATFLISLADTLQARGLSNEEFTLRLSREEIGQFLGLKLETVSRLFSRFAESGLVQIRQRHVKILDRHTLEQLLSGSRTSMDMQ